VPETLHKHQETVGTAPKRLAKPGTIVNAIIHFIVSAYDIKASNVDNIGHLISDSLTKKGKASPK
jgi:hypothetical protein